ncbi:CHAT domain-containing protein [Micromonospora okii]|uniref:CHAT domain-containing protein n=1 Tax=Micromonospora okii TaxID=1182970 RepID=UPI001E484ED7|nr:CHAT domain-containing protein [Micromonospora okii]
MAGATDRDRALHLLRARLTRMEQDPTEATDGVALVEAARLTLHRAPDDVEAALAVGALHLVRAALLADEASDEEEYAWFLWCAWLHRVSPDLVPVEVRDAVAAAEVTVDDADLCAAEADALLADPVAADPAALDLGIRLLRRAVAGAGRGRRLEYGANLGSALRVRYAHGGDPADVRRSADALTDALAAARGDEPELPVARLWAALTHRQLYELDRADPADLDRAVALGLSGLAGVDPQQRAAYLPVVRGALRLRYGGTGDPADLDAAIALAREEVALATEDVDRGEVLADLAGLLSQRHDHDHAGGPAPAEALALAEQAERLLPATHPRRAVLFGLLAGLWRGRSGGDDRATLDRAVAYGRAAVAAAPPGHPDRLLGLHSAALAHRARFDRFAAPEDIAEAIRLAGEAAREAAPDDPERTTVLLNLTSHLTAGFAVTGRRDDLDRAVETGTEALAALPAGHPERAGVAGNLGNAHHARYELLGREDDLDRAVRLAVLAAEESAGRGNHPGHLAQLAQRLLTRYERHADPADLHRAASAAEESLRLAASGHPDRPRALAALRAALLRRFDGAGVADDLHRAVALAEEAVGLTAPDDPELPGRLVNLGAVLRRRGDATGDRGSLDDAVLAGERALGLAPAGHPDRPLVLAALAGALSERARRHGDRDDLDRAITIETELLDGAVAGGPEWLARAVNLGVSLADRARLAGDPQESRRAVDLAEAVVAATPANHPDRPRHLANLCSLLTGHFELCGRVADADRAVAVGGESVRALPPGHPYRPVALGNLMSALLRRYERYGALADLDAAVAAGAEAVEAATPVAGAETRAALASVLTRRYERTGDAGDLDRAVLAARTAAEADVSGPRRADLLNSLGITSLTRYRAVDDPADLDAAVTAFTAAAAAADPADARLGMYRINLAMAVLSRYAARRDPDELDTGIALAERAVDSVGPDHPEYARYSFNLGVARWVRFRERADERARTAAVDAFRAALRAPAGPPAQRMAAGRWLAELVGDAGDPERSHETLTEVLALVPALVDPGLPRPDRQHQLDQFYGLGQLAAAAALTCGRPEEAWSALEQGRGVLLGQALRTRGESDRLRAAHPALAEELEAVRLALDDPTPVGAPADATGPQPGRAAAGARLERLLDRVRAEPGFARFGLPPTLDELREATADGTVVAVNVDRERCDALILTGRGADHVPLPGLTADEATARANDFLAAAHPADGGTADNEALAAVLRWLWDAVAEPVLRHLGCAATPEAPTERWPHVWWVPTGPLSVLPIHAAGHLDDPPGPGRRTVLDRVVSSYTPTVGVLRHARTRPRPGGGTPLVIGINDTGGRARPLAYAADEARWVHRILGGTGEPLLDEQAGRDEVRALLPSAAWAHFACHGVTAVDPDDSHLLLADGALTVRELARMELGGTHLAYLSACTTAYGGTRMADESIHVASALQLAGVTHVVGTLWPISDLVAPEFSRTVYRSLDSGAAPAQAVHEAARAIRDEYPEHPCLWAAHVHHGPRGEFLTTEESHLMTTDTDDSAYRAEATKVADRLARLGTAGVGESTLPRLDNILAATERALDSRDAALLRRVKGDLTILASTRFGGVGDGGSPQPAADLPAERLNILVHRLRTVAAGDAAGGAAAGETGGDAGRGHDRPAR